MAKFDPWPIFFKREWNRNWPFLVGFAITGAIITKMSLGLTVFGVTQSEWHTHVTDGSHWYSLGYVVTIRASFSTPLFTLKQELQLK
ncbi:hypothetical protein SO802_018171 [Lithocarpus litseifolius]|uniref:Uncharacterized protein n=1 Tax=Lithocarpus litseifolius TaxID=425828 RepID=A0AAW2CM39_9ROSI